VLAVSLSSDDEDDPASNPLAAAKRALTVEEPGSGAPAGGDADRLTLSAEGQREGAGRPPRGDQGAADGDQPDGAEGTKGTIGAAGPGAAHGPAVPATDAEGHPRVLRTRQGLTESPLQNYMVYNAAEGDTWSLLADRFYKSATFVPLLQAANEDLDRPNPGDAILVPVYDFRSAPQDRAPRSAAPARGIVDPAAKAVDAGKPAAPAGTTYTVVDGDNLWKIAEKVYGSGARWMGIYEANKDVMSDADSLKIGMSLRIPK
jgi:nucleoid-associated protein YgaU